MSSQPLVTHVYTADPSAHVFNGKLYIYPSHDIDAGIEDNDHGDQYAMNDYHVFSIPTLSSVPASAPEVTDHGVVLSQSAVPWVSKQLWAPDCAYSPKTGKYYLYFPARDKDGVFRVGAAVGDKPEGPFEPDPEPIKGSYSIDPACFVDDDGEAYLYFGGIWGGQLQCWSSGSFDRSKFDSMEATEGDALFPRVAKLNADMRSIDGEVMHVALLGADGKPIPAHDHEKRFFEAAWLHKYKGIYYFSYSTGDTHLLAYATGDSPLGPFTYRGTILEPVLGWTTHHSIVEFEGRWWLFHHDASLSGGKNHLRCVKVREIFYTEKGEIKLEK
ncbi:hypothetical protein B7494_g3945 [Chlorociboria aeruginascens]|nr:hypothetical protein B7494_g3945 [Chlorociboria aeruginascens]